MAQVVHAHATSRIGSAHHPATGSPDRGAAPAIAKALNALLADSFALYLKTKNFHWHVIGPHFRPYHLLFDEHAEELSASTEELAERVRAMGARPAGAEELRRIRDGKRPSIRSQDMLSELMEDNEAMAEEVRKVRGLCERHADAASTSLLQSLLGQTERRREFLCDLRREQEEDNTF
jgi:starvation-inducible DNA-binding protein